MTKKTYVPDGQKAPISQIGATLEALASSISGRHKKGEQSYTQELLRGPVDEVSKKIINEAGELSLAAKDADWALYFASEANQESPGSKKARSLSMVASESVDHLRFEAADVMYHLMVMLQRFGVDTDEFSAELNNRMGDDERPAGGMRLYDEYVNREDA